MVQRVKEVMLLEGFVPGSGKGLLLLAVIGQVSAALGARSRLERAPQSRGFSNALSSRKRPSPGPMTEEF